MDPITLATLIATGVRIIGGAVSSRNAQKIAKRNTDLTIAANQKNANLAFEKDKEQLAYQNEYNTPTAQMKRFKDAGLNPNLIYTQGNAGNQSSLARYQPPTVEFNYKPFDLTKVTDPIADLPTNFLFAKKLIAENKISEARATIEKATAEFARTLAKNKLSISNFGLQKLERDMALDFEKFSVLFEPKKADWGGSMWVLKSGMEQKLIDLVMAQLTQPLANLSGTQASATYQEMINDLYKATKVIGTAIPALSPLLDAIKLYYFGAKSYK